MLEYWASYTKHEYISSIHQINPYQADKILVKKIYAMNNFQSMDPK